MDLATTKEQSDQPSGEKSWPYQEKMSTVATLKYVPESCECLEVDGFQHMLRSI